MTEGEKLGDADAEADVQLSKLPRHPCLLSLALIHLNVQGAKRRARRRERERRRVGNNPVASTAYLGVREQEQQYVIPEGQ